MSADPQYSLSHCGVCVTDLERSIAFYRDGLGFACTDRFDVNRPIAETEGVADLTLQFLVQGGFRLEMLAFRSPEATGAPSTQRNQIGLTHLSFVVDDVDEAARHLVRCGGTVVEGTRSDPSSGPGPDTVFVADPDGTRIELLSWPSDS
jgi:lactoylglutathione lyase